MNPLKQFTTKFWRIARYEAPLHIVLLLTNIFPDNTIFLRIRGFLVRPFLKSCGRNLRLGRNVTFHNPQLIFIGHDVFIAYGCMILATEKICIDDEVMFGPYCVVISGNHTRMNHSYRYGSPFLAPITIHRGSWVAAHSVITAGAAIGCGALIAANSVVKGTIPDHAVAVGSPARVIRLKDRDEP